jgi:hypothetical protein
MFLSTVFFRILVLGFIERQKRFGSIWILLRLFVFRISHLVYLLVDGTNSVLLDFLSSAGGRGHNLVVVVVADVVVGIGDETHSRPSVLW